MCVAVIYLNSNRFGRTHGRIGVIIGTSVIPILIATPLALKIEQTAGYYECKKCQHKYVPTYKGVFYAMHFGRTRYMQCPKCRKKSWNKKVLTK